MRTKHSNRDSLNRDQSNSETFASSSADATKWSELARKANYSTAALAALLYISVRQLERDFLETAGEPPKQWINNLRLQDALAMLAAGNPVKVTAISLSYKHSQSFSRAFKQFFGISPSGVRSDPKIIKSSDASITNV